MRPHDTAGADGLFVASAPALRYGNARQVHHGVDARQALRGRLATENVPRRPAECANRMAVLGERLHQVSSDETGCARYRDVHGVLSSCSVSRVQAETPENVGVGVRVAAVERITVMNLDHGIESAIVSGRPFDNFLAQYIRLEQQREVDPPDRMLQDVVRCQAAGLISGQ